MRWRNEIDPARYLERAGWGSMSEEPLDAETLLRERIMLGLRLATGFDLEAAAADLGVVAWTDERSREADKMLKSQRLIREGAILRIPNKAWLFTDDTAARLF